MIIIILLLVCNYFCFLFRIIHNVNSKVDSKLAEIIPAMKLSDNMRNGSNKKEASIRKYYNIVKNAIYIYCYVCYIDRVMQQTELLYLARLLQSSRLPLL